MNDNIINKIKILRAKTDIPFIECKNALLQNDLNIEKSIDYLRKHGILNATQKSKRLTSEGLITIDINENNTTGIITEINCETDFVAKSEKFINFCKILSTSLLKNDLKSNFFLKKDEIKLNDFLEIEKINLISQTKENIIIKRIKKISTQNPDMLVFGYAHGPSNYGKIASLITLKNISNDAINTRTAKDIAMQIVAMKPKYINIESVDKTTLENEKNIIIAKTQEQFKNKTTDQINKIIDSSTTKFYKETVLLEQDFIKDQKKKVNDIIKNQFEIIDFSIFEVGTDI